MRKDYVPSSDQDLDAWLHNFYTVMQAHFAEVGLVQDDLALLDIVNSDFYDKLTAYVTKKAAAQSARAEKDTSRGGVMEVLRPFVRRISNHPGMTDGLRELLGLNLSSNGQSTPGVDPSENRPLAVIDIRQRLQHTLRIQNETPTGTSKAKPAGVLGAEVWKKVGDPPADPEDMEYVGLATRSPFVVDHAGADGNKTAHYQMRWVGSNGEKGAWSEVETATIAA